MALQQVYPFTTPGNYTYDANLVEVVGGKAQLKNQIDPDELFYNNFATKDLLRTTGGGSATGTLAGSAAVAGGLLSIPNATGSWTINPQLMLGADPNIGCIRLKYTPQYSGSPGTTQYIYEEKFSSGANRIWIYHNTSGNLQVEFRNSAGAGAGTLAAIAGWAPTAGTTYEIELNFNTTTGTQKLYLNGVQQGPDHGATFVRTATANLGVIGFGSIVQNFNVDDFQRFGAMKHTSNFASEIPRTVPETTYSLTNPTIRPNTTVAADALAGLSDAVTEPGSDSVTHTISVAGTEKYWDGAAWSDSDGSLAQTNSAAVIAANAAALDISGGATIFPVTYLHSDDGSTTPDIDELTLSYDHFQPQGACNACIITGYVLDNCGPISGAKLTITSDPDNPFFTNDNLNSVNIETTTNAAGYFEFTCVETATANVRLDVLIEYTDLSGDPQVKEFQIIVPNQATATLEDIVA